MNAQRTWTVRGNAYMQMLEVGADWLLIPCRVISLVVHIMQLRMAMQQPQK
jgi:hypothetical protein